MKMPRLRSILIAFLLSVSFVVTACTSKQPEQSQLDLSGCWSYSVGAGDTLLEVTYTLKPGGNFTRRSKYLTGPSQAVSLPEAVFFGKWFIDNEYVIFQESQDDTKKNLTLKVISNYELRFLGSSSGYALSRC